MTRAIISLIFVGIFDWSTFSIAQMSSTNYAIRWDAITTGGSDSSSSSSYILRDSLSNSPIGLGSSTNYSIRDGYRAGVYDQVIAFEVFAMVPSSDRNASSLSGLTITASTSGLSVGDFVALVQDLGVNQISAIGKITSIGSGTITVDELRNSGTAPSIDGAGDHVYRLSGISVAFSDLSRSTVTQTIVGFNVSTDVTNGYVVQIQEDGDLRNGSEAIDDVSDGSVTSGSEEYGGRSSDTSLASSTFDTTDTALTTSFQQIATRSSAVFEARDFMMLKVGASGTTTAATYSQNLSLIVSGTY